MDIEKDIEKLISENDKDWKSRIRGSVIVGLLTSATVSSVFASEDDIVKGFVLGFLFGAIAFYSYLHAS